MSPAALISIFVNIISPIAAVALLGWLLGKVFAIDARNLSRLMLYLFSPALIFTSTYRAALNAEFAGIALFALIITALMGVVTFALIKILRYDQVSASAFALSVLFVNAGNYGLPLVLFAFGEQGLAQAAIFFALSNILCQTLAVFIAARGHEEPGAALLNVFKLPLVYAVALGVILNLARITVPDPVMKTADLLSQAAVPVMLVILGLELGRVKLGEDRLHVALAAFVRLAIAPVVAFGLAAAMGMTGTARSVCIIESSMPTAVLAMIVAVEFKTRPEFVTGAVFVSTVASIVSLTILLGLLM